MAQMQQCRPGRRLWTHAPLMRSPRTYRCSFCAVITMGKVPSTLVRQCCSSDTPAILCGRTGAQHLPTGCHALQAALGTLAQQPGVPSEALPWLHYGACVAACAGTEAEAYVDAALAAFGRQVCRALQPRTICNAMHLTRGIVATRSPGCWSPH